MRRLLLLILTAAWRALAGGLPSSAELRLSASPAFFSFQALPPASTVMSSSADGPSGVECECRSSCAANRTCLGYGYSDATKSCLLTDVLPMSERMEASADVWQWHARGGARWLGEPCTSDQECSILTPGSACLAGVCACRVPFVLAEDRCAKTGEFVQLDSGRLSAEPVAEAAAADVDECKLLCADNLTCLACEFSAADGQCLMYAEGVTSDAGSGGAALSFLWRFPRPDGTVPDTFRPVGDEHVVLLPSATGLTAAATCLELDAILYPAASLEQIKAVTAALPGVATEPAIIGFEDMLVENRFVSSDGDNAPTIYWKPGEPNNINGEQCTGILPGGIIDLLCGKTRPLLCQYVGDNLALGKRSWMNMAQPSSPAANANDGDAATSAVMSAVGDRSLTWTVDLGGPAQVTSVFYLAGSSGADHRNTKVLVGSDPVRFDDQHSARCVWLEQPFVAPGYGRLFRCVVPVTGRYVRVSRDKPNQVLDVAELAVFGNRLL